MFKLQNDLKVETFTILLIYMIVWKFTCRTTLNSNYTICRFLANKFKDLGLYGSSILEASEVSSVDILLKIMVKNKGLVRIKLW